MLLSKDRGRTFPGCTVPGYGCQTHHAVTDWDEGGQTNITDLTVACKPHNLLVEWLDYPKTQRRHHRMDPATRTRQRPDPSQRLPQHKRFILPKEDEG